MKRFICFIGSIILLCLGCGTGAIDVARDSSDQPPRNEKTRFNGEKQEIDDDSLSALEKDFSFAIQDKHGDTLISSDDIVYYDWETHSFGLPRQLSSNIHAANIEKLVGGAPFAVVVNDQVIYEGDLTTHVSSIGTSRAAIVVNEKWYSDADVIDVHIQLGYPTESFFKGEDLRSDERIRKALMQAGKLR